MSYPGGTLLRKKIFVVIFSVLVVFVLLFGVSLYRTETVLFPIKTVKVKGVFTHVSRRVITEKISPHLKKGFFSVSATLITKELKAMPWVEMASVYRHWPETLQVVVKERIPVARWKEKGLIDDQGQVFFPKQVSMFHSLPLISGPEGEEKQLLQDFEKISKILEKVSLNLHEFSKQNASVTLTISQGIVVVVSDKRLSRQLKRFIDVYPSVIQGKEARIARVDLRYHHGMAVKWKWQP